MERLQIYWRDMGGRGVSAENPGRALKQLHLLVPDLVGMDLKVLR